MTAWANHILGQRGVRHTGMLVLYEGMLLATQQGVLRQTRECLSQANASPWQLGTIIFPVKVARHAGMFVRHKGMLAADNHVLLANADNHVARQGRLLVLENGVLIPSTKAFLSHKGDCLGQVSGCSSAAKQPFHQTRASSCHTIKNA